MDASALILEQLRQITIRLDDIQRDGEARGRRIWEKLNEQDRDLALIKYRMGQVETAVNGQQVAMDEMDKMRVQAMGAGWVGKKLIWIGGGLMSLAAWLYSVSDSMLAFLKWIVGK